MSFCLIDYSQSCTVGMHHYRERKSVVQVKEFNVIYCKHQLILNHIVCIEANWMVLPVFTSVQGIVPRHYTGFRIHFPSFKASGLLTFSSSCHTLERSIQKKHQIAKLGNSGESSALAHGHGTEDYKFVF